jgi:hypothetical protein
VWRPGRERAILLFSTNAIISTKELKSRKEKREGEHETMTMTIYGGTERASTLNSLDVVYVGKHTKKNSALARSAMAIHGGMATIN